MIVLALFDRHSAQQLSTSALDKMSYNCVYLGCNWKYHYAYKKNSCAPGWRPSRKTSSEPYWTFKNIGAIFAFISTPCLLLRQTATRCTQNFFITWC